jgi:CHAT domain-containing protein
MSQVNLPDPLEAAVAGTRAFDGLLSAKEIVRDWDLEAELVTLSGCETGLGRKVRGEGYIGFSHAFLQAGARSLVVSLWKVDDQATALFMRRFYENLYGEQGKGEVGHTRFAMSKARALQGAKQWLRDYTDGYGGRPYRHPYYWSAFVLIGDRQ